ncbi:MAG TPA: sigma-54-dependent Fis family transcriptional regulator [Bacteroidetes bacterium]|nr:sigma-54-dependent Fis family transcriptional regulator [Bacteroidota bacterium]
MKDRILIVDDEANIRNSLHAMLTDEGYECLPASSGTEALRLIHEEDVHLIITDMVMPEMDGMELLEAVRKDFRDVRVIILTAFGTVESAVKAMKFGAVDFLLKPIDFDMLLLKVRECFKDVELRRELEWLKKQCRSDSCAACLQLIGESRAWRGVLKKAEKLAKSDITVLITGESGTGKEVLARLIHRLSDRADEPFVPVNCGGLPETLLDSELFGVVKGAYSGAIRDRDGLIRAAKSGTLFLDEISELSHNSQSKLLRVLQDGEIRPLGSDQAMKADCRFIAATNQDLKTEILQENFREDLYYRISSFVVHIPPLRERWEDIPALTKQFIYCHSVRNGKSAPMITSDAISVLQAYSWPGNVRQLENVIKGALLINEGEYLTADDFPPEVFESTRKGYTPSLKDVLARFERSYILRVLNENSGDKKAAADQLKISLTTLYQKIKDLNISIPTPGYS